MTGLSGAILTVAEMRRAELACGVPLDVLMERAGTAVAEAAWRFGSGRPVLILCGPGNNSGDGYVAARVLRTRGAEVRVAAFGEARTELARAARERWTGPVEVAGEAGSAPVVVDAVFGTGLTRPLDADIEQTLMRICSRHPSRFALAVDLPSGTGTNDGAALGAPPVDMTLALGALKPAHLLQPAAEKCGVVQIADIGIAPSSSLSVLARPRLAAPDVRAHKYTRGYAVIAGGAMGGAALLSARAAMRLAGYVAITGAKARGPDALIHRRWADVADDERIGALLIGPGLGRNETARERLGCALATRHPLVLDADALMLAGVDAIAALDRPVVLTPHEGEFATLFGALDGSKVDRARAAAKRANAVVILKGADTVIAEPGGEAVIAPAAPGWLASAGTGDVLAGIVTARLAATGNAFQAAQDAVWLHGEAARLSGPALIADDLPAALPRAVAACL